MARNWVGSLLHARRAQEDAAKQRLAAAHRDARRAAARVRYNRERVDSLQAAGALGSAPAFVAAAVALQAAAATHAAATQASVEANRQVSDRHDDLGQAAIDRRTAEQLHENRLAQQRAREQRAAQRQLDEVAASVHRRASQAAGS